MICFDSKGSGDDFVVFDPCAGEGVAIAGLLAEWFPRGGARLAACEMEATRAEELRRRAGKYSVRSKVVAADAFRLVWPKSSKGCSVLYLNPPYDSDPEHGRLEHRWLSRFGGSLAPGGALVFVVPARALRSCADYLARNFTEIRCWRFPEPEWHDYRQVVLIGRRAATRLPANSTPAIVEWSVSPLDSLPVLPETASEPLRVRSLPGGYDLTLSAVEFDLQLAVSEARLFRGQPLGTELGIRDLIGRQYPTALPPKPGHLALAMAAGHFNGFRLRPNQRGGGYPPILVKGMFTRELVEIERKVDAKGHQTGSVQVEQPRLRMTGLRLDNFEFFRPAPGTAPTEAETLDEANTADVMLAYSDALADLMARQFPPLHDPGNPRDQIPLPDLLRKPMTAQRHGILAALKLLALRRNPKFVSEVGTGKTTMGTTLMAALSPGWHSQTQAAIRALGGRFSAARLPLVRRTLVVCPPHLIKTWRDEVTQKIWPSARVVVVESAGDIDRDGDVYVLSREAAKLGHGMRGCLSWDEAAAANRVARSRNEPATASGLCPKCGSPVVAPAEVNARQRRCCEGRTRVPLNLWARLAEELAPVVLNVSPVNELARILTAHRPVLLRRAGRPPAKTVDRAALSRIALAALAEFDALLGGGNDYGNMNTAKDVLVRLALASGDPAAISAHLARIVQRDPKRGYSYGGWTPYQHAREAIGDLSRFSGEPQFGLAGEALQILFDAGQWQPEDEIAACGEPLYQAVPEPRRFPLARYICRQRPDRFDLLVLDEFHEYCNQGTAQQKAAHRLVELGIPTIALSGSVMGGYSSSLFINWWSLDRDFREAFAREERSTFVERFGFQKYLFTPRRGQKDVDFGSVTDREDCNVKVLAEVPGVLPLFLLRHLLPSGVVLHKTDLDWDIPPCTERPAPLELVEPSDFELLQEYGRLETALLAAIKNDMFTPLQGKLWGALGELPSYLDRATSDQGPFEIRYPEDCGGALVAVGKSFPAAIVTPKERWLLDQISADLAAGRRALVFVRHTGSLLPHRLLRLVKERLTSRVVFLSVDRVPAKSREDWINKHVIEPGVEVLIVNPNAVRTGLNNLVAFASGIWYEADYDARTYRQANGRLHRLGQVNPVDIWFPYYPNTTQAIAADLIARKVTASLQVDALSVMGALEAAGAGDDSRAAVEIAMQMGEAIYRRLQRRPRAA